MDTNGLIGDLLQFFGTVHVLAKPIVLLQLVIILLILRPDPPKDPWKTAEAVFFYLMQIVGIILMTVGAIPTLAAVIGSYQFPPELYLGLLLIFATGGILFLWMDNHIREIDEEHKMLPAILYLYSIKIVGVISLLIAALTFSIAIIGGTTTQAGWWAMPIVVLVYGSVLTWLTSPQQSSQWNDRIVGSTISTTTIVTKKTVKPVKKKRTTKKKTTKK